MNKRKASGGKAAATIIKVIFLIIVVVIILAAAVFGVYYGTNGFGGSYATFITRINGNYIFTSGSIALPSDSEIKITSFSDYSFKVIAAEIPEENDFELVVGENVYAWSEFEGKDFTAGFTFSKSDGNVTITYKSFDEILSAALKNEDVSVSKEPEGELFSLIITSDKSSLTLAFSLDYYADNIITDPSGTILFKSELC